METLKPYIGSYMDSSVFLNNGKYGWYLNHNSRLYSVPQCFQKPNFGLQDAIKIIEYKKKMKEQQIDKTALSAAEDKKDFQDDILKQLDREPNGVSDDGVYNMVNKIKNKKKF